MQTSSIGIFLIFLVIGLLFLMSIHARRTGTELRAGLKELEFFAAPCSIDPIEAFACTDLLSFICYRGKLRSGLEVQLLFARRRGTSVLIRGIPTVQIEQYVGILLPRSSLRSESMLRPFAGSHEGRRSIPTRIATTESGAMIVNFRCPHCLSVIKAHLQEFDDWVLAQGARAPTN